VTKVQEMFQSWLNFADTLYKYIDQYEANLGPEQPKDFTEVFLMEKKRGNSAFESVETLPVAYSCAKYFKFSLC